MNPITNIETIQIMYSKWREAINSSPERKAGNISLGQQRLLVQWFDASEAALSYRDIVEVLIMAQSELVAEEKQPIDVIRAVRGVDLTNDKTQAVIQSLSQQLLNDLPRKGSLFLEAMQKIKQTSKPDDVFWRLSEPEEITVLRSMSHLEKMHLSSESELYEEILNLATIEDSLAALLDHLPIVPTLDTVLNKEILDYFICHDLPSDHSDIKKILDNGFEIDKILDEQSIADSILKSSSLLESTLPKISCELAIRNRPCYQVGSNQWNYYMILHTFSLYIVFASRIPESLLPSILNSVLEKNRQNRTLGQLFNAYSAIPQYRYDMESIITEEFPFDFKRRTRFNDELRGLFDELNLVGMLHLLYDDPTLRLETLLTH